MVEHFWKMNCAVSFKEGTTSRMSSNPSFLWIKSSSYWLLPVETASVSLANNERVRILLKYLLILVSLSFAKGSQFFQQLLADWSYEVDEFSKCISVGDSFSWNWERSVGGSS